jgi:hypothetical protein
MLASHSMWLIGVRTVPCHVYKAFVARAAPSASAASFAQPISAFAFLSFQAPEFYPKFGYREFGRLDYPPDQQRIFFQKRLIPDE